MMATASLASALFMSHVRFLGPLLIMKSGRHRGMEGVLYDAEAYIDVAVEI